MPTDDWAQDEAMLIEREGDVNWADMNIKRYLVINTLFIIVYDTLMHPMDVIKTRQQHHPISSGTPLNVWQTAKTLLHHRGIRGLYTGLRASLCANTPSHLVYFGSYEASKQLLLDHYPDMDRSRVYMVSAVMAETSTLVQTPGDVIARRMMVRPLDQPAPRDIDVAKDIVRHHGIRHGLWRGSMTSLLTNCPSSMIWFSVYEHAKVVIHKQHFDIHPTVEHMVSGGIAGAASVCISNPFDVLRTLVQTGDTGQSMATIFANRVRTQGILSLTRGMLPRMLVSIPGSGFTFASYELVKWFSMKN